MDTIKSSLLQGFVGSWLLAFALVAALVCGVYRVLLRIGGAYVAHKPLPIAPGKHIPLD